MIFAALIPEYEATTMAQTALPLEQNVLKVPEIRMYF
jgi:hypothetical protein